jgi:hypothetical protein
LVGIEEEGEDYVVTNTTIDASFKYSEPTGRIQVVDFKCVGTEVALAAKGEININSPYEYMLVVEPLEVKGPALAVLERNIFGTEKLIETEAAR